MGHMRPTLHAHQRSTNFRCLLALRACVCLSRSCDARRRRRRNGHECVLSRFGMAVSEERARSDDQTAVAAATSLPLPACAKVLLRTSVCVRDWAGGGGGRGPAGRNPTLCYIQQTTMLIKQSLCCCCTERFGGWCYACFMTDY